MLRKSSFAVTAAVFLAPWASAHHSVLNYDGKVEVTITGTVAHAHFGYPHSIYRIDVEDDDGSIEKWTLTTEDPRDAKQLGFADALRNLKRGATITVVGWPDKFKERNLRGHQLIYPDGTVVMLRRGNYIWPKDILKMDGMALHPETIPAGFPSTDQSLSTAKQVIGWIEENDHLTRIAREYADGRPRLIGLHSDGATEFPGMDRLLQCHTKRPGFTITVALEKLDASQRAVIDGGAKYISEYNRVLSRWWEQEKESCE